MKFSAAFLACLAMMACTYGTDAGRPLTDRQAAGAAPRLVVRGSRVYRSLPGYNITLERSVVQGRQFAIVQVNPSRPFGSTQSLRAGQVDQMVREAYRCSVDFEKVSPGTPLLFVDKNIFRINC